MVIGVMAQSQVDVASTQNVRLRLTTREADLEIGETAPVLIPTSFRRYHLSQYINSQLHLSKPVPFEIIINGDYLRTSIDDYLGQNGISAENTLTVEYVRARIPPRYVASYQHDDWVSDVSVSPAAVSSPLRILTASYDGHLRIWDTSSSVKATSAGASGAGHASSVKSARFISPTLIASASVDRTVKIWRYRENDEAQASLDPALDLYGHRGAVESVRANDSTNRLLTASSDHTVGFWSTKKSDAPPVPEGLVPKIVTREGKRRKLNPAVTVPQRGPLSLLRAHTAPVSEAVFDEGDPTVSYSCSFDHSIRTWDLVTGTAVDTRTTQTPLFCITQLAGMSLLAAGSASRDVKLIDPRASATQVVAMTLKGHRNHVVTLACDPNNGYALASGSHDGTVRIWDLRSTRSGRDGVTSQSIFTILRESLQGKPASTSGEGIKVFGLDWHSQLGLLSAGEDRQVQINSSDSKI